MADIELVVSPLIIELIVTPPLIELTVGDIVTHESSIDPHPQYNSIIVPDGGNGSLNLGGYYLPGLIPGTRYKLVMNDDETIGLERIL